MSQLSRHLQPDEKVLWSGKPVFIPFIFSGLIVVPVIGIVWLIFAMFFVLSAISMRAPMFPFILFSLFVILMGLGIILGPVFVEFLRYRNTEYMITNQRIIAQTGAIGIDTRFVELNRIQEVYVTVSWLDKIYGTGSIVAVTAGYVPVGVPSPYNPLVRPALKAISNPYEVQRLLQEAIRRASGSRNKI
ncbi:MAG: PH domain-containing protein [Candidatus Bathyarchaeia archaeon]